MKQFISKIQKEISQLQSIVEKEGNDFIKRMKKLPVKTNIDQTKAELIKILNAKLKKLEPTYNAFIDEIYKNAKKAGIDLTKIEKNIKSRAKKMKKQMPAMKKKTTKTTKKKTTKKTKTVKKTAPAVRAKKKTTETTPT